MDPVYDYDNSYLIWLTIPCLLLLYKVIDYLVRLLYLPKDHFDGRYILITGCDSGFGRLLTTRLDKTTLCRVFACCLKKESVNEIRETHSKNVIPIQMDISKSDSVTKAFHIVQSHMENGAGLYAIVNNAGMTGLMGALSWMTRDDVSRVLDVNVLGTIDVIITFLPLMKQTSTTHRYGGRIINMASVLGRFAPPFSVPYSMSKRAIESLSDSLRLELYHYNISVHVLEPGFHATQLTDTAQVTKCTYNAYQNMPESQRKEFGINYVKKLLCTASFVMDLTKSSKVERVIDTYIHAIFARFPRSRYLIGFDARVYTILGLLPEWMADSIFLIAKAIPIPDSVNKKIKCS